MPNIENNGFLLIVTGPKGVGKDSVITELGLNKIVGHATRAPRPNELCGVDYHFISEADFVKMSQCGEFVEQLKYPSHACASGFEYKGTSRQEIARITKGESLAWRIDPTAAAKAPETIRRSFSPHDAEIILASTIIFYIGTPNLWDLSTRLTEREGKALTCPQRRSIIKQEWSTWSQHRNSFDNVVINETGRISQTAKEILTLINQHFNSQ